MKNKIYSITLTLLLSTIAINGMDLEHVDSQEDLQVIPLETIPQLNQLKTSFQSNNEIEATKQLLKLCKESPQTLQSFKTWLKDQKINPAQDQLMLARSNILKPYVLASGIINVFAAIMNSTKTSWPLALISYTLLAGGIGWLIWTEKQQYQFKGSIQRNIDNTKKINILLSAMRKMKSE